MNPTPTRTAITVEATNASAPPAQVGKGRARDAIAMSAKLVRSNSSKNPMMAKTTTNPVAAPRSTIPRRT